MVTGPTHAPAHGGERPDWPRIEVAGWLLFVFLTAALVTAVVRHEWWLSAAAVVGAGRQLAILTRGAGDRHRH